MSDTPTPSAPATPASTPTSPGPASATASDSSPGAPSAPAAQRMEFVELVIDGKPERMSAADFQRYKHEVQKERAAEKRFYEANRLRQEHEQRLANLRNDPAAFLREHQVDPREFAERVMAEQLRRETMTPEQRELAEERSRREALEARIAEREQAENEARITAEAKRYQADFLSRAEAALTKAGYNLADARPGDPRVMWAIRQMAHYERATEGAASVEDLAQAVLEDADSTVSARIASLEGESLLAYLDARHEGLAKRIAQAYATHRLGKGGPTQAPAAPTPRPSATRNAAGQFTSPDERAPDRYAWRKMG